MDSPLEAFLNVQFDYLVIGTHILLCHALTEDPAINVGILEAGLLLENDPIIDVPRNMAMNNGQPGYDWVSSTTPQAGAAGRSIPVFKGKLVGGSSALNYMAWDRASKEEYDAWKLVGDAEGGWDWDALLPFMRKAEDAASPSVNPDIAMTYAGPASDVSVDMGGVGGPVKLSYPKQHTDAAPPYVKAWNALGLPSNANPWDGDASGLYSVRLTIDHEAGKRVTATSAYYTPVAARPNLKLLTGAQVTKILFQSDRVNGNLVATGVEFIVADKTYTVSAAKEIVLCGGATQTPQILELSGIGNGKLLESMGLQTLIDLPGVGENLQDHPFIPFQYQVKAGIRTFDELRTNPEFAAAEKARYEASKDGWMRTVDNTVVFTPLDKIVDEPAILSARLKELDGALVAATGNANALARAQYAIQRDWLRREKMPHLEFILLSFGFGASDENYFTILAGLQHPFSRGSVHIQSANPLRLPLVDPQYLKQEFDIFSLLAGFRAVEKLVKTQPLASIIAKPVLPAGPLNDEEAVRHIRQTFASGAHQMGTAAMARRELGGVVGNNLKVHGTANLRVVDASIIPAPIAAHIQSTVYAIAEKVALAFVHVRQAFRANGTT
ncbi:alcohol oxidase [Mycena pura]|uniref:Alcohol oxidase n=1 Tax=Mycena pura TaxID=153505 RepID=A0AAD6YLY8_9AGAR|nr:alcohol oxidase [Mycena pura]